MGKLALIGLIAVLGLTALGVRTSDKTIMGLCVILVAFLAVFVVAGILWYSHMHPEQATLEGMEVVIMAQQKAWAAKGISLSENAPVLPNPNGMAPQLNPPMEPDR